MSARPPVVVSGIAEEMFPAPAMATELFDRHGRTDAFVAALFEELHLEFQRAGGAPQLMIDSVSRLLILHLLRTGSSLSGMAEKARKSGLSDRDVARLIEFISFGAIRATAGSSLASIRSANSCDVVRMLRRSWLTFETALPS